MFDLVPLATERLDLFTRSSLRPTSLPESKTKPTASITIKSLLMIDTKMKQSKMKHNELRKLHHITVFVNASCFLRKRLYSIYIYIYIYIYSTHAWQPVMILKKLYAHAAACNDFGKT